MTADHLNTYLAANSDVLTLTINITTLRPNVQKSSSTPVPFVSSRPSVGVQLDNLLEMNADQSFSDIMLVVGGKKLPAHKNILISQSSVFRAMFAPGGMKESADKEVTLHDIEVAIIENMLRFMYGAPVDSAFLKANVLALLAAADMYDIVALRTLCEKHITSSLAILNAADSLFHADKYHLQKLKEACLKFISENYLKVIESEGYKAILHTNCELVLEINKDYAKFRGYPYGS
eukprot:TRINITY_DN8981_c0_g1_i1.p1 TRINITY_DN8981_c0_g1~~TRINITY_DN8981_c0_g1_i1.p1  ORF type:complete len:234 (+),score=35.86 TRINITY_DN8981_c0_g1_i1:331-1032(+)